MASFENLYSHSRQSELLWMWSSDGLIVCNRINNPQIWLSGGFFFILAQVEGFEPPIADSESAALPLGDTWIYLGTWYCKKNTI